jgi:hypothetical protein
MWEEIRSEIKLESTSNYSFKIEELRLDFACFSCEWCISLRQSNERGQILIMDASAWGLFSSCAYLHTVYFTLQTINRGQGPMASPPRHDIETHHQRRRQYVCSFCEKLFWQPTHLKDHVRIHTGEKPYECVVCKRRFTQKSNLKKHMTICLSIWNQSISSKINNFDLSGEKSVLLFSIWPKPFSDT